MKKIGIIVAMREEVIALKRKLTIHTNETRGEMIFSTGTLEEREVVMVQAEAGMLNTAICTQMLISIYGVDCIINTGLAGGLSPEVKTGDIILATDRDLIKDDTSKSAFTQANKQLLEKSQALLASIDKEKSILIGKIASHDPYDSRIRIGEDYSTTFTAYCAEMEMVGIAYTCQMNDVPFLVIRCVSDTVDVEMEKSYQDFAHYTAKVTMQFIEKLLKSIA